MCRTVLLLCIWQHLPIIPKAIQEPYYCFRIDKINYGTYHQNPIAIFQIKTCPAATKLFLNFSDQNFSLYPIGYIGFKNFYHQPSINYVTHPCGAALSSI